MLFTQFIWTDYLILFITLLCAIFCYRKGFVASTLTYLCWIVSILASFRFANPVGSFFQNMIHNEYVRNIVGFFIVFIVFALISVLILYLFNHLIEKALLYKTDKTIGGFSGIVVGIFLISALLLIGRYSGMHKQTFWTKSYLIPYLQPFEDIINDVLPIPASIKAQEDVIPEDIDEKIQKNIINPAEEKIEESMHATEEVVTQKADEAKEKIQTSIE